MSTLKAVEANKTEFSKGSIKGAMKIVGASSKDLWQVPLKDIVIVPGLNPRISTAKYKARIRRIANSILAEGFFQHMPLGGFVNAAGEIVLRAGFTRYAAALLAKGEGAELEFLPMVVSQEGVSTEDITVAFVKDNDSEPLSLYECAVIAQRLARFGYDAAGIAQRLDFTLQHITNLLALMASPYQLREMVANETVSGSLAIEMITKHGGEKALEKLLAATDEAKASGKEKVTAKDVSEDGKNFRKACKKQAELLFNVMTAICETSCFESLDQKLYDKLSAAMQPIEDVDDRSEAEIKAARAALEAADE